MAAGAEHDGAQLRPTSSFVRRHQLVPSVSGVQCARALRRGGFVIEPLGPDHVMVERDGVQVVTIPLVGKLRPELLAVILRTAGVSTREFVANLDDEL